MRKLTLTLSAATLALVGAATLSAQPAGRAGPDANRDGTLTLAEHTAHAAAMFARLDANGDGVFDTEDDLSWRVVTPALAPAAAGAPNAAP